MREDNNGIGQDRMGQTFYDARENLVSTLHG